MYVCLFPNFLETAEPSKLKFRAEIFKIRRWFYTEPILDPSSSRLLEIRKNGLNTIIYFIFMLRMRMKWKLLHVFKWLEYSTIEPRVCCLGFRSSIHILTMLPLQFFGDNAISINAIFGYKKTL